MADTLMFWVDQVYRHVPIVTWVGLILALALFMTWFIKRWPSTQLLGFVCVLYAVTPYLPRW